MDDNKKSGIGKTFGPTLTRAAVLYLLAWLFGWSLGSRWGLFLILWVLWFFGVIIILGGALTVISDNAGLADEAWSWVLFVVAAVVMAVIQLKVCDK